MNAMTIIDQRILVPTSPEIVWETISNINNNPKWQTDCQALSFLTSLRSGPNVRWRYTTPSGQDFVVETTAWYDGLGYEYTFIDGAPFRTSKGTIRLQEIPEGTIVQWTLNYEPAGVLSGLRDTLTLRRQFDHVMVASLKALWTYIKETGKARPSHEPRSLMRDALDYEARAQYTPRHPSRFVEREVEELAAPHIPEPPVSDDDTRPNPVLAGDMPDVQPAEQVASPQPVVAEPKPDKPDEDWLPPAEPALARFQRPSQPRPEQEFEQADLAPEPDFLISAPEPVAPPPAPAQVAESTPPGVEPQAEKPAQPAAAEQAEEPAEAAPETVSLEEEYGPKIDTSKLDTREISIWDVFGLPRPSETQRMKAITDAQIAAADAADAAKAAGLDVPAAAIPEQAKAPETPPAPQPEAPASAPVEQPSSALPTANAPLTEQPVIMMLGEETRPNVPLQMSAPATAAISPPGFRLRARRKLVRLNRRY